MFNQDLLEETKVILSILYRDYLCSEKEKREIIESDMRQLEEEQKELEEKYKISWKKNEEEVNENKDIIVVNNNESLYKKIIEFFRRIFNKK